MQHLLTLESTIVSQNWLGPLKHCPNFKFDPEYNFKNSFQKTQKHLILYNIFSHRKLGQGPRKCCQNFKFYPEINIKKIHPKKTSLYNIFIHNRIKCQAMACRSAAQILNSTQKIILKIHSSRNKEIILKFIKYLLTL